MFKDYNNTLISHYVNHNVLILNISNGCPDPIHVQHIQVCTPYIDITCGCVYRVQIHMFIIGNIYTKPVH